MKQINEINELEELDEGVEPYKIEEKLLNMTISQMSESSWKFSKGDL